MIKNYGDLRSGDRVYFLDQYGNKRSGSVVMKNRTMDCWALNLGGRYGTPGLVSLDNYISHKRTTRSQTDAMVNFGKKLGIR